jgi:lipopolysaccharide transport system ATP-binding protein
VGTGFHPELTGRENIFLNGAILGMTQREIHAKFDEIVAFAEVERFLDTPVKRYSSGMYVRLAFSVAAHLEPDILIIDEVLAVGDAEFQRKCLGKMEDASRTTGRTVLFVSHNLGAITSLCQSAIWLDAGRVRQYGPTRAVLENYRVQAVPNQDLQLNLESIPRSALHDGRVRLESLQWLCELPLRHGEPIKARINFSSRIPLANVAVGIGFCTLDGRRLLSYATDFQEEIRPSLPCPGTFAVEVEVASLPLAPDIYVLDIGCRSGGDHLLDFTPGATQLEVIAGPKTPGFIIKRGAGVRLASRWNWFDGKTNQKLK